MTDNARHGPDPAVIYDGEFLIDGETGEIVGNTALPPGKILEGEEDITGFLFRLQSARYRMEAVKAQAAEITANAKAMVADQARRIEYLERWLPQIEAYAQEKRGAGKMVRTAYGNLQFRDVPPKVYVKPDQDEAAIRWLRRRLPVALKTEISVLPGEIAQAVNHADLKLPKKYFGMTPRHEGFSIERGRAGRGKEKKGDAPE